MTSADIRLCKDIENILKNGHKDDDPRPRYADGTPAHTYFVNHRMRQYNLSKGEFPICTLRPIAWKSAIKEIFWIFKDQSNSLDILRKKYGIYYWDDWESKDLPGTIGVRYGETVRRHKLIDKLLADIITDPYGRRHILSLWREEDFIESDGLLPCCYETVWNVRGKYLDMLLNQRSGDLLAASGAGGVNEVQYAALLIMVAKTTGYKPGVFTHIVANEQIYDRHIEAVKEILSRRNYVLDLACPTVNRPVLEFSPRSDDFYSYEIGDFHMQGYAPMEPQLKFDLGI